MKRVVIESPLSGDYEYNRAYAKRCMLDSIERGEAPYASHLLFAQPGILDDTNARERCKGMMAGFAWGEVADLIAVYIDLGVSDGMRQGIERHKANGIPIDFRSIDD